MRETAIDKLKVRRTELNALMQDLPAEHADRRSMEEMISNIDKLLGEAQAPRKAPRAVKAPAPPGGDVLIATVPKTETAELRIYIKTWRSRRTVDVRLYYRPAGSDEFVPSRKGVSFDASKLDGLLSGLALAQQHVPTGKLQP